MKNRQVDRLHVFTLALVTMVAAFTLQAVEVTSEQAKTAAGNWIRLGPRRMGSEFRSMNAESVKTARGETGRTVFHAVNLEGGGFVVTSGDTRLPPIIAFSATGSYSDDETGPFHALLQKNLGHAVSALERSDRSAAASPGIVKNGANSYAAVMAEWEELLSLEEEADDGRLFANTGGSRKDSLSDVRVDKLLKTEWGQRGMASYQWSDSKNDWDETYYPAFDYYVPKNYPCGCVATGGAQIMKYWQMPKASIAQFSNTCSVDKESVTLQSVAGAFDWGNMYLIWDAGDPIPTLAQRKAVGMLTYNVAVAIGTSWGAWYGSASPTDLIRALKERFGYKSGTFVWYEIAALNLPEAYKPYDFNERLANFNNALYASLDAKMPVFMSIDGDYGGHGIVADGYGYISGKRYTHLNFGWYGRDDAWYYLVDEMLLVSDDRENYSVFSGIGFNIHPSVAGDVISGRVLDASGTAVSGATLKLYDASSNLKASTSADAKGIYSFRITAAGDYTVRASFDAFSESPSKVVSISALSNDGSFSTDEYSPFTVGWSGNKWGVDLKFSSVIPVKPTPVSPTPVTPGTGGSVKPSSGTSCYNVLNASDIVAPYGASNAVTLQGAVYDGCDVVGIVELKLGKVKGGAGKISGAFIDLSGKKHAIAALKLSGISGTSPQKVSLTVKNQGTLAVTIGGTKFAGSLGKWHVQTANIGVVWRKSTATVSVDAKDLSMFAGTVRSDLLPKKEVATASGGKWTFDKAASIKMKKGVLVGADDPLKPNKSGLKLAYTPKKGTFKGSFKVYAVEGAKLKKYSMKVNGVVVDGVGYGLATCKKPAASWAVTVK